MTAAVCEGLVHDHFYIVRKRITSYSSDRYRRRTGSSRIVVRVTFVVLPMSVSITNALMNTVPLKLPEPIVVSVTTYLFGLCQRNKKQPNQR